MKISTRKYLKEIEKAKMEGITEGGEAAMKEYFESKSDEERREGFSRLKNRIDQLEDMLFDMDKRINDLKDVKAAEGVEVE